LEKVSSKVKRVTEAVTGLNTLDEDATEVLQVVNYGIGGHYEPHVDYFGATNGLVGDPLRGDRVATMLFYVSDDVVGGATVFPFLKLAVKPEKGSALFWYNTHRSGTGGDLATLHAGCPVVGGSKWITNLWIRELAQTFVRPCPLERPSSPESLPDY
jgi:prolyl 4-hydroxylase